jgi:hypothetical protein
MNYFFNQMHISNNLKNHSINSSQKDEGEK